VNRTDQATRRATTSIVAAVALFAAGDSYSHIYTWPGSTIRV